MSLALQKMHLANTQNVPPVPSEQNLRVKPESAVARPSVSFRDILDSKIETPVHFSKHAALRLSDRNISLTGEQIDRVAEGIGKAGEKGIRDSLVLVDDVALVVNVKSRMVITALNQAVDNVFSNIDGAVIV
ncbi:MAG: flagellar protein [Defluviitaleaceae bacterium]|nr:flagellar protein [Defluviitaleaceae bacterium]